MTNINKMLTIDLKSLIGKVMASLPEGEGKTLILGNLATCMFILKSSGVGERYDLKQKMAGRLPKIAEDAKEWASDITVDFDDDPAYDENGESEEDSSELMNDYTPPPAKRRSRPTPRRKRAPFVEFPASNGNTDYDEFTCSPNDVCPGCGGKVSGHKVDGNLRRRGDRGEMAAHVLCDGTRAWCETRRKRAPMSHDQAKESGML